MMSRRLLAHKASCRFAASRCLRCPSSVTQILKRRLALSTARTSQPKSRIRSIQEHPIRQHAPAILYTAKDDDQSWSISKVTTYEDDNDDKSNKSVSLSSTFLYKNILSHFLPADYPSSVTDGYARFAALGFCASVAGSAAMVLSTQTLLLAVGIFGHNSIGGSGQDHDNAVNAGILAGALNWVLKDGIGQLGGVWFASYMGRSSRTSQFDASPKYWRMVSALVLDAATLLEITSPLVPSAHVLAVASIANVGKNIGFLTASASRAALHQSLAKANNLADLTAKAGSQSMAASLLGTAVGIGLSPILGDVQHFILGFVGLSLIHLGCNYLSLKAVQLSHFDRHRLHLVLEAYFKEEGIVLDPVQVANRESFLPLLSHDDSHTWISLGSTIREMGGPAKVVESSASASQSYVLVSHNERLHLVFHDNARASDMMQGMHHAYWLHCNGCDGADMRLADLARFCSELQEKGWNVTMLRIEPPNAVRINVNLMGLF